MTATRFDLFSMGMFFEGFQILKEYLLCAAERTGTNERKKSTRDSCSLFVAMFRQADVSV